MKIPDQEGDFAVFEHLISRSVDITNGGIVGYALCREFARGHVIGPIVASNDEDAIRLTAAHLEKLSGQFARIDTREKDGAFVNFLE